MRQVVIIGASGFVGSALLEEALGRGWQVKALVRNAGKIRRRGPELKVVETDVTDEGKLEQLARGAEAVISAFNPGWSNPDIYDETLEGYRAIIEGVRRSGVARLLVVGGAGSLYVKPGVRVLDGPVPEQILPGIKSLAQVYYDLLMPEKALDWIFLSPSSSMTAGERTAKFRLGKDDLLVDEATGKSHISVQDYAVAMIDELEEPRHHRERFTVGY